MGYDVVALVLLAAVLHAGWNAMLKIAADRLAMMALLAGTSSVLTLVAIPFLPMPATAAWPYIVTSTGLHIGYQLFLIAAYRHGDLAQVYPIARGGAPVLTALVTVGAFGQVLPPVTLAGVALVATGIMSLSFQNGSPWVRGNSHAVAYALGTAGLIAAYTICDGLGVRAAENPHAYTAWLFLVQGPPLVVIATMVHRRGLLPMVARIWRRGAIAGGMSLTAYWLVLWALSLGAIAPVAALRETSVVFAALIGAVFLGEAMTRWRLTAALLVTAGVMLLKL